MTDKIFEQITDFFKNSKNEFSIGLQNFQGIREYTTIPLAPLTLVYGQNSAGKSTIHDAQQFIYHFFSGKWNNKEATQYLDRCANHHRISKPLTKGYLGEPEDVVLSMSSCVDNLSFNEWAENYYQNRTYVSGSAHMFFNYSLDLLIPYRIDIHFSTKLGEWRVRQISLYLGGQLCLEIITDDFIKHEDEAGEYSLLKLNKNHLVYSFLNSYFKDGLEQFELLYSIDRGFKEEEWFLFDTLDVRYELEWRRLIDWYECDQLSTSEFNVINISDELLDFRTFILSLLYAPTFGIEREDNFNSVPPLRPIPSKESAIFRFKPSDFEHEVGWRAVAKLVLQKIIRGDNAEDNNVEDSSYLGIINRFLSHSEFLNTDYELTGECLFMVSVDDLNNFHEKEGDLFDKLRGRHVEVHLKLKNKSNGSIVEIEDVGVGISQIIPVLIAITRPQDLQYDGCKVFIQQPELHLHPKLQSQLADTFVVSVNQQLELNAKPCFIIESHSEHFLLRLLRRIRETNKSDIKNKLFGLSSEQVSVLYVDKLKDGSSKIFPLRISEDGEFIDRWPNGFFTERDGELFDE